jgi:tripartite-type tricarboxylate transporter receptor subunit TctC
MKKLKVVVAALIALASVPAAQAVSAQEWPQRAVRIMAPFAAGGSVDAIARTISQRLGEVFGEQFVIENRPGAGGTLAAEAVARAPADGYTLLMGTPSQITIAPTQTKTSYDPVKDFAPISMIGSNPFVLVAHPSVPAKNLTEFVSYARGQQDGVNYAHAGVGTIVHLAMVVFQRLAGIEMVPVVYKGGASQVLNDVVSGHMSTYLSPLPPVLPLANSGTVRLLGVTSAQRMSQIPDVPTFAESGFPGYRILTWSGLMAPAGTPKAIIDRIVREIAEAIKDPGVAQRLTASGVDLTPSTPEEFSAMIAAELTTWAEAAQNAASR